MVNRLKDKIDLTPKNIKARKQNKWVKKLLVKIMRLVYSLSKNKATFDGGRIRVGIMSQTEQFAETKKKLGNVGILQSLYNAFFSCGIFGWKTHKK